MLSVSYGDDSNSYYDCYRQFQVPLLHLETFDRTLR